MNWTLTTSVLVNCAMLMFCCAFETNALTTSVLVNCAMLMFCCAFEANAILPAKFRNLAAFGHSKLSQKHASALMLINAFAVVYNNLGCWKDTRRRTMTQMRGGFLDGDDRRRVRAIAKCAMTAIGRQWDVFGVQVR